MQGTLFSSWKHIACHFSVWLSWIPYTLQLSHWHPSIFFCSFFRVWIWYPEPVLLTFCIVSSWVLTFKCKCPSLLSNLSWKSRFRFSFFMNCSYDYSSHWYEDLFLCSPCSWRIPQPSVVFLTCLRCENKKTLWGSYNPQTCHDADFTWKVHLSFSLYMQGGVSIPST